MMSKPKRETTDPGVRIQYYDWTRHLPMITSVAFVLALALVTARVTMPEFLREAFEVSPGAEPVPGVGLPDTSLWMDLLCCLPALLVLVRRAIDRTYVLRLTPAHALVLLLALWAFASTIWAADRFAAAVNGFHFISAAVVCWAGSQLVRSWQRLRIVAAACAGILVIIAAQGIYYRLDELPANREYLEKNKDRILAERNWTEDSFAWKQFSRKVTYGEMIAYYTSPNTTATMIVTLGIVAAALAAQRIRDRDEWAWPAILLLILPAAAYVMFYTAARAGYITPILGALLVFIGFKFGGAIAERRRLVFMLILIGAIVAAAGLIAYGAFHGTLFHDSLTFRWKYWTGSAGVFAERWLAGVGYSNFGYYYLAHRLPEAAEEIKDPHNILVRAFVELGIVGGALMIGWLTRVGWEITRPIAPAAGATSGGSIRLIFVIAVLAILINALFSIDFSVNLPAAADTSAYVATELMRRLLHLGLLILVYAAATIRSRVQVELDDRPAPLLLIGFIAAIAMFFVHCMIDFAFFESGPMHVIALLIGATIGVRGESLAGKKKWNRTAIALAGAGVTAWLVAAIAFVIPTADAENRAQAADEALRKGDLRAAISGYRAAFDNSVVRNADYAWRCARAAIIENKDPAEIDLWLSQAVNANRRDGGYRIARATWEMTQPPEKRNAPKIIADFTAALLLDPSNIPARLQFAEALESFGDAAAAREQYRKAIDYNDKLDKNEPKRLSGEQVEKIRARLKQLEAA